VLRKLQADGLKFKILNCPSRNLSESRNIGISAAAGDVVFFIDDDAVAHPNWVERLMLQYADPNVGGAGGFTVDHTGITFQCRYTICDREGNARFLNTIDPTTLLESQGGFYYPSLLGTNCSFRRSELEAINGFDEVFVYMLDETDVCLRIYDRKKRIVTVPNALVFHKYAPSHSRTVERIPTALLAPARSKVYFSLKHSPKRGTNSMAVFAHIDQYRRDIEFANRWYLDHKKVTAAHYLKLSNDLTAGIAEGMALGMDDSVSDKISEHIKSPHPSSRDFLRIVDQNTVAKAKNRLRIYFVSQGYPPDDTAGIARWTHESAQALVALGHEVHVLTRTKTAASHVDYVDGVWVHSLDDVFDDAQIYVSPVPIPDSIARRCTAVVKEIQRAEAIWGVDVVSAPIWDVEGIFCAAYLDKPVVTSLHTTYLLALPFKPEWTSNRAYRKKHVGKVVDGERWLFENSKYILANTNEIVKEINSAYGTNLGHLDSRVGVIPHGTAKTHSLPNATVVDPSPRAENQPVKILFVGRLEPRKGPDQILAALLLLPKNSPPLEVVFVGLPMTAVDPYTQKIEALTKKVRAHASQFVLKFEGYVEDAVLSQHYASTDIFIAPSRFESFGLIVIEAMQYAKPIITCDVGGMKEIIDEANNGYLFPVDNLEILAKHISKLVSEPALRATIGSAARQKYETNFTAEIMGLALEQYFSNIVKKEGLHVTK